MEKLEALHIEKMRIEESNINLNRYINELKDQKFVFEEKIHTLEKENLESAHLLDKL